MNNTPSILMCVGRRFYKLHEIISEAYNQGVSKRIPANTIPDGLVPGISKIFLAHPSAIVKVTKEGKTLHDLSYDLVMKEALTQAQFMKLVDLEKLYWTGEELKSNDFVPECMLDITIALSMLPEDEHRELVEKYDLEFCMGIFGFSFMSGIQYVCKPGEDSLPDELEHLAGIVEPVHVIYNEQDEEQPDVL